MITYDLAWVTKWRYDVLTTEMHPNINAWMSGVALKFGASIVGTPRIDPDFIYVRCQCNDNTSPLELLRSLKGTLSLNLQLTYPSVRSRYNNKTMFENDYFRTTTEATTEQLNAWRDQHVNYD